MTINILDLVNIGDIVTIPSILAHNLPVVAFGHNSNVGSWVTVDRGGNGGEQFALATEGDLYNARIIEFKDIPRNTEFIKWLVPVPAKDEYVTEFAAAYGHLNNRVWEFKGKRIMAEELLAHIYDSNPTSPDIRPLMLRPMSSTSD